MKKFLLWLVMLVGLAMFAYELYFFWILYGVYRILTAG